MLVNASGRSFFDLQLAIIANEYARKIGPTDKSKNRFERLACLSDIEFNAMLSRLRRLC